VSGQLHAPAALLTGKEPRYPLYRRLGGPESCSGHGGEEKNFQPPPGIDKDIPLFSYVFLPLFNNVAASVYPRNLISETSYLSCLRFGPVVSIINPVRPSFGLGGKKPSCVSILSTDDKRLRCKSWVYSTQKLERNGRTPAHILSAN